MLDEALNKCADNNNYTIYTSMCKAQRILMRSYDAVCSISGGSDSDIVLDLIHKVDEDGKVKYFWIDTGLEYTATKEHLDYLEQKYGITIERVKPDKPIPTCVREYGVPFLSKYVSEQMMRLQAHHFQWEDEPLEVLLQKYPRCKTALQWWCGERYSDKDGIQKISRFSIYRNRFLKEFIMANPPDFPISNKCCEYSKKKPAKRIVKEHDADLDITGIRQAEGGIRSAAFKTCFSECKSKGCNTLWQIRRISPYPTSAVNTARRSLQSVSLRNTMLTLTLRESGKLRAVSVRRHLRPVSLSASLRGATPSVLYFGTRTATSVTMRKCSA